jgi:transketolase
VSGVETTTGPLGQGIATSVGMAIAQRWLAAHYNKPELGIFDYSIYAVCGDGCLMEGVGSEAASLAAHLGLDNLCWIYDNNHITIEGSTRLAFTEDVPFVSPAMAGTSLGSVMPTTLRALNRRWQHFAIRTAVRRW